MLPMNIKKILLVTLSIVAVGGSMLIFSSCSNSGNSTNNGETDQTTATAQTEINSIITTMNDYTQSISQCNSPEEILDMDRSFSELLNRYVDSNQPINDADREAVAAAMVRLSTAANTRFAELTGEAFDTDTLQERQASFVEELQNCKTVADVIRLGNASE